MQLTQRVIRFLKIICWHRWRIPKGDYCYTILWIEYFDDGPHIIHTKICPYWKMKKVEGYDEEEGYCTLMDSSDFLVWDQCKVCGIKNKDY